MYFAATENLLASPENTYLHKEFFYPSKQSEFSDLGVPEIRREVTL
jgi:hypothetical protein